MIIDKGLPYIDEKVILTRNRVKYFELFTTIPMASPVGSTEGNESAWSLYNGCL